MKKHGSFSKQSLSHISNSGTIFDLYTFNRIYHVFYFLSYHQSHTTSHEQRPITGKDQSLHINVFINHAKRKLNMLVLGIILGAFIIGRGIILTSSLLTEKGGNRRW